MDTRMIIALLALLALAIFLFFFLLIRKLRRNPFRYPYFIQTFDVSGKRNVDINNCIDEFLCDKFNWMSLEGHEQLIQNWKDEAWDTIRHSPLRKLRTRQYYEVESDASAYRFRVTRKQKRYRQSNYMKSSYDVAVVVGSLSVSWAWLLDRHARLKKIGYAATLKDYHNKNQRRLMTRALREQIMRRDNYTCQFCGKYMPDEVGLQIDHIVPVAKGGKSVPSNLRVLCNKCNGSKGSKYGELWE